MKRAVVQFLVAIAAFNVLFDGISDAQNTNRRRGRGADQSPPVLNENIDVRWLGEDDRYAWYEADREGGKTEVVAIDLTTGQRLKPEDFPDGVPKPIKKDDGEAGDATTFELPHLKRVERSRDGGEDTEIVFINETEKDAELVWVDSSGNTTSYGTLHAGETRKQHTFSGHVWILRDRIRRPIAVTRGAARSSANFILTNEDRWNDIEREQNDAPRRRSRRQDNNEDQSRPNLFIRDYNIWTRDDGSGKEVALTEDGTEKDGYEGRILWSPTNEHFAVRRTEFAKPRVVTLVQSSPEDQLQPKTKVIDYVKPGDKLDRPRICVFSADGKQRFVADDELSPNPFDIRDLSWRPDGSAVRFVNNERGHGRLTVVELNAKDGSCRAIVDEKSKTFIDYAGKYYLNFLDDTDELVWMSERDGWNHLYLIDQKTGNVKQQITRGQWVVREVVELDEQSRTMLVAVGGFVQGEDPYYQHLLRVSLDGGEPVRLTDGDGEHQWKFSPGKKYLVDRYSRVDMPPTTTIRSLETGKLVASLETADASNLLSGGWTMPKRFTAKARDGESDIYGLIVLPQNFDKSKKYPVLELIYAGPHGAHVPKSFGRLYGQHQTADSIEGKEFIVVQIDGMGTSYRSKAFHDVCWKNIGDAGFPDRILWMQAAAKEIPQMDLERVGIWGGSAGGQNAMRALIAHGDFYKAAFSDCGCHDNRMDKIWWNELWMSWPIGPHYEEQSNVTQAHRMNGKLMLSVGELDSNVDPASTLQVVNALIKADKDFELLFFPGAEHGAGSSAYGERRRMDFFRRAFYGADR
jgi:dipeptidyl aminopeptidase/acylaminoacyl peptidase